MAIIMIDEFISKTKQKLGDILEADLYQGDVKKDLLSILEEISFEIIHGEQANRPILLKFYEEIVQFQEDHLEILEGRIFSDMSKKIADIFVFNPKKDLLMNAAINEKSKDHKEETEVILENLKIILSYANLKIVSLSAEKNFQNNKKLQAKIWQELEENYQKMVEKIKENFKDKSFFAEISDYLSKNMPAINSGILENKTGEEKKLKKDHQNVKITQKKEKKVEEKSKIPAAIETEKEEELVEEIKEAEENEIIEPETIEDNEIKKETNHEILQPEMIDLASEIATETKEKIAETPIVEKSENNNSTKNEKLDKILAKLRNKASK